MTCRRGREGVVAGEGRGREGEGGPEAGWREG